MATINQKSYSLITRISKTFSVYLSNFPIISTLLAKIKHGVRMQFTVFASQRLASNVSSKRIRLLISSVKLGQTILANIRQGKSAIYYTLSQTTNGASLIAEKTIKLYLTSRLWQKVYSLTKIKGIRLSLSPIYGSFFLLSAFDAGALSVKDGSTLASMDYSAL